MLTIFKNLISPLSEFLAALAIIASGGAFLWDQYQAGQTQIHATVVHSKARNVSLFISNSGGKDIAIKDIHLTIPEYKVDNEVVLDSSGLKVEKGKTEVVRSLQSRLNSSVLYDQKMFGGADVSTVKCNLVINFLNSDGESLTESFENTCVAASFAD